PNISAKNRAAALLSFAGTMVWLSTIAIDPLLLVVMCLRHSRLMRFGGHVPDALVSFRYGPWLRRSTAHTGPAGNNAAHPCSDRIVRAPTRYVEPLLWVHLQYLNIEMRVSGLLDAPLWHDS